MSTSTERFRFGDFTLDAARASLRRGDSDIGLRPKPFELLHFLVAHADRLVSKDELLAAIWPRVVVTEDSLTRCISEVRAALGDQGLEAIRTLSRRGYMFVMPVTRLPDEAPAESALGARAAFRTELPEVMQPLVAREEDLARVSALMTEHRLITIVGPGGVGKSCLAQWLLHRRRTLFEHGVVWVDLSAVVDADRVVAGITAALGLPAGSGEPLPALLTAIRPLQMLVALDNAEHLADEVARLALAIHDSAPGVRLLVTSQVPLRVSAERVYRLEALPVPAPGTPADDAQRFGSVVLFAQRTHAADAHFEWTGHDIELAVDICRHLDGLPLSIELAAARAPSLGLATLSSMLNDSLNVLNRGRRDAPDRQQTLHAALAWSHSLLNDVEQTVFRRLGVFAGSFTLDSTQSVAADEQLDRWVVLDAVGTLVDHSMLSVVRREPMRYRLLETTRTFAAQRLEEAGEADELKRRHAMAFRVTFERACADYFSGQQHIDTWRTAIVADLDNGLAASAWANLHDVPAAISLAASLALVFSSERPRERRQVLDATRALLNDNLPEPICARWHVEAAFAWGAAQPAVARHHGLLAAALFRRLGDQLGLYRSLSILLYCEPAEPGDDQRAAYDELRALDDTGWPAIVRAQGAQGAACWLSAQGLFDEAVDWRRKALSLYVQAGSSWQQSVAQANLMDSLLAAGRADEAIDCGEALEARLRGTRQLLALPAARLNLAAALLSKGDAARARLLAIEGWPQAMQLGWQPYWADHLALLACIDGRPRAASRLLGYADIQYAAKSAVREVNESRAAQRAQELATEKLGADEVERLKMEGARFSDPKVAEAAFAVEDSD